MDIKILEQYALDNYEEGGHWVYECFSADDYRDILDKANGDIKRAKTLIKKSWELTKEQAAETRWE